MKYININYNRLAEIASDIAMQLSIGDIILLKGDIGSGKTTFTKMLTAALGNCDNKVTSPTFNIVHQYNCSGFKIWHIDLYRIKNSIELQELGLDDLLNQGILIIEWPEIAQHYFRNNYIEISLFLTNNEDYRNVIISRK